MYKRNSKIYRLIVGFFLLFELLSAYEIVSKDINYLKRFPDIRRNFSKLKNLDISFIRFKEGKYQWHLFLVLNPKSPKGPFWFLPHDNENSAFDSAVYAVRKYGGGFLSIYNRDKRYNKDQDPNRNFSLGKNPTCKLQRASSSIYTSTIMKIINTYKSSQMPYLSLHNNTNKGGISILKESKYTKSFLAYPKDIVLKGVGLADEDNLVYIAGSSTKPPLRKIQKLLNQGLNVKYEIVTPFNNDCSFSNFIVLNYGDDYYNIEAEHGKSAIQKEMIDRLMKVIRALK